MVTLHRSDQLSRCPFFRNSRLKLAGFCVLLSAPDPKCALTPSDPKIRAGKFNIFALTRAVLRTLKKTSGPRREHNGTLNCGYGPK